MSDSLTLHNQQNCWYHKWSVLRLQNRLTILLYCQFCNHTHENIEDNFFFFGHKCSTGVDQSIMWWSLSGLLVRCLSAWYRLILSPVTISNRDPFHTLHWRLFQFNNWGPFSRMRVVTRTCPSAAVWGNGGSEAPRNGSLKRWVGMKLLTVWFQLRAECDTSIAIENVPGRKNKMWKMDCRTKWEARPPPDGADPVIGWLPLRPYAPLRKSSDGYWRTDERTTESLAAMPRRWYCLYVPVLHPESVNTTTSTSEYIS